MKNAGWIKNPVDAFVLAKLDAMGLTPAPEADRRTLIRRVSLDLTGLPPTPAEVEAFVNDPSPDAYEKFVDRLLASPHWGEHRGRYWLDAARYADTHGIHFDNYREIWSYRDWVINAFNRNMPFDQFTDRATGRRPAAEPRRSISRSPRAFNRCNITTNEGGAIAEEVPRPLHPRPHRDDLAGLAGPDGRLRVCHDHKFDPLPAKEFYELAAFFNNTTQARWTATSRTRRRSSSCRPPRIEGDAMPCKNDAEDIESGDRNKQKEARQQDFDKWLARRDGRSWRRHSVPTSRRWLACTPLNEGNGKTVAVPAKGRKRAAASRGQASTGAGHRQQSDAFRAGTAASSSPDAGDFEKDQAVFLLGAGSSRAGTGRRPSRSLSKVESDWPNKGRGWTAQLGQPHRHINVAGRRAQGRAQHRQSTRSKAGKWTHVCRHLRRLRQGRAACNLLSTASRSQTPRRGSTS